MSFKLSVPLLWRVGAEAMGVGVFEASVEVGELSLAVVVDGISAEEGGGAIEDISVQVHFGEDFIDIVLVLFPTVVLFYLGVVDVAVLLVDAESFLAVGMFQDL
jgi:hypothetical protein